MKPSAELPLSLTLRYPLITVPLYIIDLVVKLTSLHIVFNVIDTSDFYYQTPSFTLMPFFFQ